MTGITATAETEITASPARVWSALTDPAQIKLYMFGSEVETDWEPGGTIVWRANTREGLTRTRAESSRWSPSVVWF